MASQSVGKSITFKALCWLNFPVHVLFTEKHKFSIEKALKSVCKDWVYTVAAMLAISWQCNTCTGHTVIMGCTD